jgi:hypothetical protein
MDGVQTQLQVCPECGRNPSARLPAFVRPRILLWLPVLALALAAIALIALSYLRLDANFWASPPYSRVDRSSPITLSDRPTLGQMRRYASGSDRENLTFDNVAAATSTITGEIMRDDAIVRVGAVSGLTIREGVTSTFGWPTALGARFASREIMASTGDNAPTVGVPLSVDVSWAGLAAQWTDARAWQSYAWIRFSTLLLAVNACVLTWLLARWLVPSRRTARACAVGIVFASCGVLGVWPVESRSVAPSVIPSPGNAAPTGYTLKSFREAIATPEGRRAFIAKVVSTVDDELIDVGSRGEQFRRRTAEIRVGIDATAPAPANALRPPSGWPDDIGVFLVLSQSKPPGGWSPGWTDWNYGGFMFGIVTKRERARTHAPHELGFRTRKSPIDPAIQYWFNSGNQGVVWEVRLDRLAFWLTYSLTIPMFLIFARVWWVDRRVERRLRRGECVACAYPLVSRAATMPDV